ncbi:MAG: formate--tetrahydrofolate ligase, partial [Pseudomonadota bacterium]
IAFRRVVDMNDRSLRQITSSLGGVSNGFAREDGFDITVASEIMAIFCLARDLDDLTDRIGNIVVGYTRERQAVRARDIKAHSAMAVLLKDALMPNLVQTLENNPAFIHGGPFANIAHGCNSVSATKTALKLADYVVTEAGFGADLGAEKFFDIKCRKAGLAPAAVVLVATVRALKMHGGVAKADLGDENVAAVEAGCSNLARHLENVTKFGVTPVVAINQFINDTDAELAAVSKVAESLGAKAIVASHWANGGAGTEDLARHVVEVVDGADTSRFAPIYPDDMPLFDKIKTVCHEIYRAEEVTADAKVQKQLADWEADGYGDLPVCMAKTQYSFSTNPDLKGAPEGHTVNIREVRLSAGAGFIVAIAGDIMTMPGLPRVPAAEAIHLDEAGQVQGLF